MLALALGCSDRQTSITGPGDPGAPSFANAGSTSSDWQQCANNGRDAGVPPAVPCEWISSVLNVGKATYFEGEVIPFRFAIHLKDVDSKGKTIPFDNTRQRRVTFTYGFTKATNGNYDFLAKFNSTERHRANLCSADFAPVVGLYCSAGSPAGDLGNAFGPPDPLYDGAHANHVVIPIDPAKFLDGVPGNLKDALASALTRFTTNGGKLEIDLFGALPGSTGSVEQVLYKVGGNDVTATITVKFYANAPNVLMAFGAHFARIQDWRLIGYEGGAGQSGSPFHIKVDSIDGTGVGALGNNVAGGVVQLLPSASISVATSGVNAVGEPHPVTVTLLASPDEGEASEPVANALVTFTKDASSTTGDFVGGVDSCTTGSNGTCTVNIVSQTAGVMIVNASSSFTVGTTGFNLTTNGQAPNSGPLTKRWVEARLLLTPATDENLVGTPHVLTAALEFDLGDGNGFVAAPAGETIGLTIVPNAGSQTPGPGSLSAGSCTTGTGGSCQVTLTNTTTAGLTTIHAAWSGTITVGTEGSASAIAQTGTSPSGPDATKTWVLGSITLSKSVEFGPFTTSATICFTLSHSGDAQAAVQTTSDNPQCKVITTSPAEFKWEGLVAGTYDVTESSASAPYAADASFTGIQVTDANRNVTAGPASNPLPTGSLLIQKLVNGLPYAGSDPAFQFNVSKCGAGSSASSCVTPVLVTSVSITGANNPATVSGLAAAYYQVSEVVPAGYTVTLNDQIVKVVAGDVGGALTVTFDNAQQGGDVCVDGKPAALVMLYNRNGYLNDFHEQETSEVIIRVDDITPPTLRTGPVWIRMYDHRDQPLGSTVAVPANTNAELTFQQPGKLIPSRAGFRVFLQGTPSFLNNPANAVEHVQFHSSCSQPLEPGYEFGSFRLLRDING